MYSYIAFYENMFNNVNIPDAEGVLNRSNFKSLYSFSLFYRSSLTVINQWLWSELDC